MCFRCRKNSYVNIFINKCAIHPDCIFILIVYYKSFLFKRISKRNNSTIHFNTLKL